ncbi:MAG: exodeoxyribonuclease V subunit beta, partial [Shewanellaceae bacterium]|nr:exodeoxyribonuclease V subunit beta [Shewanellaceae bacterium]
WLQQPHQLLPNDLSRLSWSKLKITKKSLPVDQAKLSLLVAVDDLLMQQQQLQIVFYQTARVTIQDRLRRLKAQESILFADDLMIQLKQAITEHSQRDQLIKLIRERFPVALIDEFQDTDAIQFDIFEKLYRDQNQLGWYMIGDPKQAIYAFRGADIFTYMQAKADTSNQHHLTTNYRSASDMVDAVNHLFTATARNPFVYDMITYQPVLAHQTAALQLPRDTAALHFRYQATDCTFKTKADATRAAADDCAQHITDLLNQAQLGQAHIKGRPLEPRDIAILVRSGAEAKVVAKALANRGVGSVYLSRDRVFETPEAEAMTFILKAMAYPKQELAIRNALATPLLGRTYTQINQFNHDEDERCYWLEKFAYYHQLWHQQNWLVAFAQLMLDSQMASRLLQQAHGARQLTDIRHLSEIIQAESQRLTGSQALLNWYEQQCHQPDMPVDTQQLRLESEHNLITITTIHKSKGLEYNLCWLPFLSLVNQHRKTTIGHVYHDDNQQLLWNCNPNSDTKAKKNDIEDKVKQEELAEAIRLLYVAFTRAKYRVYTHIAQVKTTKKTSAAGNFDKSPLGFLLGCEQAMTTEQLIQHLQALVQAPHTALVPVDTDNNNLEPLTKLVDQAPNELHVLPPTQPLQAPWWLSSYSGLVRHLTHPHRIPVEQPLTTSDPQLKQRFEFDRGAHIGTFLHQIFEDIEFADPDSLTTELPLIMERYQIDSIHYTMLHTWVTEVLATELQPRLRLNQLRSQQVFKELEFFMPMLTLTDTDLNQLLQAYNYTSTPALNFDTLQGMLKGFVDLVFEWEGRYYIADYKSNFLGIHEQDYSADKLQQAINEHRYDVQYLLYTVALHLMLQLAISDYQYETHFGGCYYLFIRAMQPQKNHGVFFDRPNPALIETLAGYFQQQAHSTC